MKKHKKIVIVIACIVVAIVAVTSLRIVLNKQNNRELENDQLSTINQVERKFDNITGDNTNIIEEIKNEIDATADTNMYQVQEEYDGRKIIQIKPDIQYDTVLAGILKNDIPKELEIQEILKNRPTKSGIWISKQSRDNFIKLLINNNMDGYEINEEGYLNKKEGTTNEILNRAIDSDKLYILDISGKCYERDDISGKIVEYPFEDMEPDQVLEIYSVENSTILEITTNSRKILSNKEILDETLLNINNN